MDDDGLLDWELLHGSDTESTDSIISEKSSSVNDVGMIILSDHFSADNLVAESGDSFRVDYGSEPPNRVDLGLGQFSVNLLGDDYVRSELGVYDVFGGGEVRLSGFDEAANEKDLESEAAADERHVESQSGVEEPIEDSSKSWSDSGGHELVSGDYRVVNGEDEIISGSVVASTEAGEGNGGSIVEVGAVKSGDEGKSREIVWWKMPFVLLKYSMFKIGPVWSVSMAAAVMGLVLLGRRLYNMKKKAQRFHLKVTIDDKKALRVMSQAARLNEVFTEVRRVPVIRPALPSPSAWPVMSLR
ncbi:PREDICTED: ATG8-interacting protein 2-like [Camelina sativa]|uniref:ATG8-interacting protein 2-like n=1 Tax=Camelina sativa TaxID=90675 RepID=A0ABM0VFI7_CAMSA|nr:PREDICTED: ATG8-interacting protein 2-like [Camelina sativa]